MGREVSAAFTPFLVSAIILVQTLVNIIGVRLTAHANLLAVIGEIVGLGVVGAVILSMLLVEGHADPSLLFTIPATPVPYWPAFLMASLIGAWTFVGFEAAADMSEETHHARRVAPFGVVSSIVASVAVGFVFIAIMTAAIPDLHAVTRAENPLAAIMTHYLGTSATKVFLAFVLLAVFSCSLITMAAASRLVFAMARDGRLPAASMLSAISRHHVPTNAILLVTVVAVLLTFNADSVTSLYGAVSVLSAGVYLFTVLSFAAGGKNIPPSETFSLGRLRPVVTGLAAVWLLAEIAILTVPRQFHSVAVASAEVFAAGLVLYPVIGRGRVGGVAQGRAS